MLNPNYRNRTNCHPQLPDLHPSYLPGNQNPGLRGPGKGLRRPNRRRKRESPSNYTQVLLLTQTSSLSRGQMANQAAGSNHRSTGKTQILPYAIKSSSGLSTKARIAEDMTKGVISQGQSKYKGMRIPRKAIPPGESRPPVPPTATNSQLPLESPQGAPSPHSPSEHSNRTQIQKGALQKRLPLQPEEPPHDVESDHMDVDQPEFACYPPTVSISDVHQPGLLPLLFDRKIL